MQQPRRGLGFWRFVLAMLLGIGTWWGAGFFSEARPQWRTSNSNSNVLYPVTENAEGTLSLAYLLKVKEGQWGVEFNDICVLDANTGQIKHAMKDDRGVFDANSYYSLVHAQPRILGDKVWRVIFHQSEEKVTYELRVWDFTRSVTEQVVKQWNLTPGEHFAIAFVDSHSPYFVTQTSQPWQPLLVGMSLEGWSQLTAALAFTPHFDVKISPHVNLFNTNQFVKTGLVLPQMQSWKLTDNLSEPLVQLASWTMPALRKAWPPVMSADLSRLAFGDTMSVQEWNENALQAIGPLGMLRYDGRTGKKLTNPITVSGSNPLKTLGNTFSNSDAIKVTGAGDLLLVRRINQTGELVDPFLLNAVTGERINWPAELSEVELVRAIHVRKNDPSTLLIFHDMASYFEQGMFNVPQKDPSVFTFRRDGNTLSLIHRTTIASPGTILVMPNCISGNEIVIQIPVDTAPPLIKELSEKYQWLTPHIEKLWPNQQPAIKVIDLNTGKCLKSIVNAYQGMPYQFNEPHHFFVTRMNKDEMTMTSLEAWRLPFASQTWSPWWSRAMGLVMFVLFIWIFSRKQPTTKAEAS